MGEKQSKGDSMPEGHVTGLQEGSGDAAAGKAVQAPQDTGAAGDAVKEEVDEEQAIPSEGEILAKLVAHLGKCPDHSMSLADIRMALPSSLRKFSEDVNTISKWLQKFPGLIQITGEPGHEQVVLTLGGPPKPAASAPAAANGATGTAHGAAETSDARGGSAVAAAVTEDAPGGVGDDDNLNASTVQLRGLPFRAQANDIKNWLGSHMNHLSPKEPSIRLLLNRDGRPSGFARVVFVSPEAAQAARAALHKQLMGDRYVEVLACTDRAGKARNRRVAAETTFDTINAETQEAEFYAGPNEAVERERVLQECRDHMRMPGRQTILLSMLGIALSPQARAYLRRVNLGLKHFLARFPCEFHVDGPKGCEKVIWMQSQHAIEQMTEAAYAIQGQFESQFTEVAESLMAAQIAWAGFGESLPGEAQLPPVTEPAEASRLLASPTPQRSHQTNAHCQATPSDWGTPGSGRREQFVPKEGDNSDAPKPHGVGDGSGVVDPSAFGAYLPPHLYGWAPTGPWAGMPFVGDAGSMDGGKGGRGVGGKKAGAKSDHVASSRSHAHLHPQAHPFAHQPPGAEAAAATGGASSSPAAEVEGQKNSNVAALRLRGLPFSMNTQDVLAFFAQHDVVECIADDPKAAQMLPKANGRPSGQARVIMRSRQDAEMACQALNNQWIGGRYIEVFVYGEDEERQANEFGSQLGYLQPDLGNSDPILAWQKGGFPSFPPIPFPGTPFGAMGAPPWAMASSAATPGADGTQPADVPNLDNLFSFLYSDIEGGSTAGTEVKHDPPAKAVMQV